uniref:Nebulette n=1 Tax=Canis lupus familiaris TaxID=9615 RepID=A0A8C0P5M1_CANLF
MLSNYSSVADTPEIQRIKTTQQNISAVFYKKEVGAGTAVKDTPETERVKKNQQNISSLQYKEQCHRATPVSVTPEMERVRRNQEQLSMASGPVFSCIVKRYTFLFFTELSEKLEPSTCWMLLFTVACSRA